MNAKLEAVQTVREILAQNYEGAADQIIREGKCMIEIGKALKPLSIADAKTVMRTVAILEGCDNP